MCVTQLNFIEIKGNYRAPAPFISVSCHQQPFVSGPFAGWEGQQHLALRGRLAAAAAYDVNSSEVSTLKVRRLEFSPCCNRLQINSPEPNLSWSECHRCEEFKSKHKKQDI